MNPYTGTHFAEKDTKGRVVVPKAFRHVPKLLRDATLMLSPSPSEQRCVEVYPEPVWEARIRRVLQAQDMTKGEVKRLVELLMASVQPAKIDQQNRLALPQSVRAKLGISTDEDHDNVRLAFVGAGTYFKIQLAREIKEQERARERELAELMGKFESGVNTEDMFDLGRVLDGGDDDK
ncbi:MAG: Transcriptional regulator MraZ [Calditrichaeota bacterium]|nr:Transcriptional regulator MraZ [Calditrichota bacterium]